MNLMESTVRGGYIAALETSYIDTTDMCLELFFWPVVSANNLHRPIVSVIAVTEALSALELESSSGYELPMWNRLLAKLPGGIHKVIIEARRSSSGMSGMSIDDVVIQPCVDFGKARPKRLLLFS